MIGLPIIWICTLITSGAVEFYGAGPLIGVWLGFSVEITGHLIPYLLILFPCNKINP